LRGLVASEPSGSWRRRDPSRADESSPLPTSALSPAVHVEKPRRKPSRSAPASPSSTAV